MLVHGGVQGDLWDEGGHVPGSGPKGHTPPHTRLGPISVTVSTVVPWPQQRGNNFCRSVNSSVSWLGSLTLTSNAVLTQALALLPLITRLV